MKIRRALLISGLMYGGGQRVVEDLMSALGTNAPALFLMGRAKCCRDMSADAVVEFDGRANRPDVMLRSARSFAAEAKRFGLGTVHSHGWDADFVAWASSGLRPIRRIVHLHVTPDTLLSRQWKHLVKAELYRRVLYSASAVVAVSDAVRRHWSEALGLPEGIIEVVQNGVDTNRYRPSERVTVGSEQAFRIGVAARLAPMKGIEYLIDAVAICRKDNVPVRLQIAGDGVLRQELERRVNDLGLGSAVNFFGQISDMPGFYSGLDAFVLPSVSTEGLPLGILEAMACGLPVIATRIAGAPEAVIDGETGYLVGPRCSDVLAVAIRRLALNREIVRSMGTAGRRRAESLFSLPIFSQRIQSVYDRVDAN